MVPDEHQLSGKHWCIDLKTVSVSTMIRAEKKNPTNFKNSLVEPTALFCQHSRKKTLEHQEVLELTYFYNSVQVKPFPIRNMIVSIKNTQNKTRY